jgi:4-hydroxy-2-oxoheptanedioate aldolase
MSLAAKQRIANGQPVLMVNPGGVAVPVADLVGRLGAHGLFIDCERTAVSIDNVPVMARAAQAHGLRALVRTPSKDPSYLIRYFDCGIDGLILPQVESADECELLVRTARTATKGKESAQLLVAQIESVAGIDQLDAIADAPGIDCLLIGPNDLAHSMGFLGDTTRTELQDAVRHVAGRLKARGKAFGLPVTPDNAAAWIERGATFLYIALETLIAPSLNRLKSALP